MKRLIILFISIIAVFSITSCEEKENAIKKVYFTEYDVYTTADSTKTRITVYVGKIGDKDIVYHVYDGKYKCQMVVLEEKIDTIKTDTINHK